MDKPRYQGFRGAPGRRSLAWPGIAALLSLGLLLAATRARADRGLVALDVPQAKLYEPTQDALVAWNGKEQLLLLRTEVQASHPTKVLEILPLPAEPAVSRGSARAFARVQEIIDARLAPRRKDAGGFGELGDGFDGSPAGRVTQRKTIGAHDLSVTQALDASRFAAWVDDYLRDKKLPRARLPEELLALITSYARGGFGWFVLDVIEVGKRKSGLEPIQYRFKTSSFFYPLRISRRAEGRTHVQVSYLTPRQLDFSQQPVGAAGQPGQGAGAAVRCSEQFRPFRIAASKLAAIDPTMAALLSPVTGGEGYLGRLHCVGKLAAFDKDLVAKLGVEPAAAKASRKSAQPNRRSRAAGQAGELNGSFE